MQTPLTLHLVRHGETEWNAERRIQGQLSEVPLSARGREQAIELADALADCQAGALISSDLGRAMETARAISARVGLPVMPEPALRERHFGVVQGKLYAEVQEIVHEWWLHADRRIEGGETNREMYNRVARFFERLHATSVEREVIVVSHGGVMNVALAFLSGTGIDEMQWQRLDNCALHTVEYDGEASAVA